MVEHATVLKLPKINEAFERKIVGENILLKETINMAVRFARKDITILIEGETGTGKELFAECIHETSRRKKMSFVALNCGGLTSTIIESELFGHEKGAFTGADKQKIGLIEKAHKGTLFLDEIGEMSHDLQVKLLRFLEKREFYRVGGNEKIKVDVRIIAATNKNLTKEKNEGNFREDLFYRVHVGYIKLPPLRKRRSDISLLISYLVKQLNPNEKIKVTKEALKRLEQHPWKGNVRDLKNVLEKALALCYENTIQAEDIQFTDGDEKIEDDYFVSFRDKKFVFETYIVLKTLIENNFIIKRSAEHLNMQRADLYRKLRQIQDKFGISYKNQKGLSNLQKRLCKNLRGFL